MGDRYEGIIRCPYCGNKTEFYYAESSGFTSEVCESCNKQFDIEMRFKGIKKLENLQSKQKWE